MKVFLQTIFVTVLVITQLPLSIASRGFRCSHTSGKLDEILENYLNKWEDSKQSMGSGLANYQKSVSNLQTRECAAKDINLVKNGAATIVEQVSRITNGCGQSLLQSIIIAQYIERLTNNKKSEKACKALGESIEVITSAAKQIQGCQIQYHDDVNAVVCASTDEINNISSKNIGDEAFFNYAKLSPKISDKGNDFEKCKTKVLDAVSARLWSLLNVAISC